MTWRVRSKGGRAEWGADGWEGGVLLWWRGWKGDKGREEGEGRGGKGDFGMQRGAGGGGGGTREIFERPKIGRGYKAEIGQ